MADSSAAKKARPLCGASMANDARRPLTQRRKPSPRQRNVATARRASKAALRASAARRSTRTLASALRRAASMRAFSAVRVVRGHVVQVIPEWCPLSRAPLWAASPRLRFESCSNAQLRVFWLSSFCNLEPALLSPSAAPTRLICMKNWCAAKILPRIHFGSVRGGNGPRRR